MQAVSGYHHPQSNFAFELFESHLFMVTFSEALENVFESQF